VTIIHDKIIFYNSKAISNVDFYFNIFPTMTATI